MDFGQVDLVVDYLKTFSSSLSSPIRRMNTCYYQCSLLYLICHTVLGEHKVYSWAMQAQKLNSFAAAKSHAVPGLVDTPPCPGVDILFRNEGGIVGYCDDYDTT